MTLYRKFADLLIFSNLFVALAVAGLTSETLLILFNRFDLSFPAFVFFATLFLYNFHRVYRIHARSAAEQQESRHRWVKEHKVISYIILAIAAAGLVYFTVKAIPVPVLLCLLPIGLISFGYSIPFIPTSHGRIRLRDIPFLKIFLIALVLGLVTVLLPIITYKGFEGLDDTGTVFLFMRRVLFIFAITIPFDIRDMPHDKQYGLKTFPVVLGVKRSKHLAVISLILVWLIIVWQHLSGQMELHYTIALGAAAIIAAAIVSRSAVKGSEYFYAFLVEGTMILQFLLVFAAYRLAL